VSWFPDPSTQPPLSKGAYRQEIAHLRQGLLAAHAELLEAPHPLLVLLAGVDGAGNSETVAALNAWMDPRWLRTHTEHALRTEILADDKRAARVAVIEAIADALERQITAREAASRSDDDSDEAEGSLARYRSGDARVS